MVMEWQSAVAGGAVMVAGGLTLKLIWAGLNKKRNGVNSLKAHDDSSSAHQDIRDDITKIDNKLDGIGKTSNKILAHLETRHGGSD